MFFRRLHRHVVMGRLGAQSSDTARVVIHHWGMAGQLDMVGPAGLADSVHSVGLEEEVVMEVMVRDMEVSTCVWLDGYDEKTE